MLLPSHALARLLRQSRYTRLLYAPRIAIVLGSCLRAASNTDYFRSLLRVTIAFEVRFRCVRVGTRLAYEVITIRTHSDVNIYCQKLEVLK